MTDTMTVGGIEFWISKRPLLYYAVSVLADNGKGRRMWTYPISMECNESDVRIDDVSMGETIIACVPAVAGSYEIFVEWNIEWKGELSREETPLGIEVPGADLPDWNCVAEQYIKDCVIHNPVEA